MEVVASYLREVSMLNCLASDLWVIVAGFALLAINLSLTFVHTNEERSGRLWNYFGHIEGVRVPDAVGTLIFFVALTSILWVLGIGAITGQWPIVDVLFRKQLALGGIGALIGVRLSDALHSHLWLAWKYKQYAENPGLRSVPLCLVEAAVLALVFAPGFVSSLAAGAAAGIGFGVGWVVFAAVRPVIRTLRSFKRLRQERWIPDRG